MLIFILNFLLFSNAVSLRRDKSILFARTAIISLLFTSFLAYDSLYIKSLSKGIGLYGGLFNVTTFTLSINIFIFLVSGAILTLSGFYPRKICYEKATMNIPEIDSNYERKVNQKSFFTIIGIDGTSNTENSEIKEKSEVREKIESIVSNKTAEQFRIIEYPLIIIFIICGATFLTSTSDLISVFLSIELQSYGLYILSTIYRDSESATASGLTYFLLGGLSSCFILLGSALLYANSGTTNLDNIYVINSISQIGESFNTSLYQSNYIQLSLIIMIVGFLFKVSAAPFHFWSPDVYDGIPTIVTTYVAIVPKISIFAFFLELVYYTESSIADFSWKNILLLSSLLSLIIGSVLGLTQFRIKRLFAYSTISHVGFILLALSVNNVESIQAYIFYIFQYSISNLNGFLILVTIGYTFYLYVDNKQSNKLTDKNNSPVQLITQIKGYFYINHFIAISLAITLFSFVGVPPLIGFFAKQMILSAALDSGHVFMALVAIITSVIGAAYYLNLIKQIFFYREDYSLSTKALNYALTEQKTSKEKIERNSNETDTKNNISSYKESSGFNLKENIVISTSLSSSISILTLLLILFIYMPEEWFNVVSIITLVLFKS